MRNRGGQDEVVKTSKDSKAAERSLYIALTVCGMQQRWQRQRPSELWRLRGSRKKLQQWV